MTARATMRISAAAVALSWLLSFAIAAGHAQATPTVSEVKVAVFDPAGAVLPESEVSFKSGSKTFVSKTGDVGSTSVILPTGQYAVAVSHYGFLKNEVPDFKVVAPDAGELKVVLQIDPHASQPCGPCGCGVCGLIVQTTSSDVPNTIPPAPAHESSSAPSANDPPSLSRVKVIVVDPIGAGIPFSEVVFKNDAKTNSASTGTDGSITLSVPAGQYAVTVSHIGFQKKEVADFQVGASQPNDLKVALELGPAGYVGPSCCAPEMPTTTSDVPNFIPLETIPESFTPPAPDKAEPNKVRSWRCLYLWKCSAS